MTELGPGCLLVCVERDGDVAANVWSEVGTIYTCDQVWPFGPIERFLLRCSIHGRRCPGDALTLRELKLPSNTWFCTACFKPIDRPALDLEALYNSNCEERERELEPA